MRKYTAFLLAMMLLASSASCGSDAPAADDTTSAGESETTAAETHILDAMGEKDFGGKTYTILDANDYPDTSRNMPSDEMAGEVLNDALAKRDSTIEDRYNVNIEYLPYTPAKDGIAAFTTAFLAGDKMAELIITRASSAMPQLGADHMLHDLNALPHMELDQPWWSGLMNENLALKGKLYFTTGDISPSMYQSQCVMLVNTNLLDKYNIDTDYYALVREGKWTLDQVIEFTKLSQDVNGDNVMHTSEDFFGFVGDTTGSALSAMAFVTGAGVTTSIIENDTIVMTELFDEKLVNVLEKLGKIAAKERFADRRDYINRAFKEDRAISIQTYMGSVITSLRDMESDYMVLPMPKYDEAQEDYRTLANGWCCCFVGIPADADKELAGFITEAMGHLSYNEVRSSAYDMILKQKAVRDEEGCEMIDLIWSSLYMDFMSVSEFGGIPTVIGNAMYKGSELASALEARRSAAQTAIDTLAASW
ncbi:MAG: hypothetical protein E7632_01370 [Ruminococcaceae bacterium]|nr:hypothetical protein [Oscillospiraceae bacterium]